MRSLRTYKTELKFLPLVALCVLLIGCSTTRRLQNNQVLYTGIKEFKVEMPNGEKLDGEILSQLKSSVNVSPNNPLPLLSPYVRNPLQIGMWVYNNWNDSARGLKGWLYDKLVQEPVLISDVKPEVRVKMMEEILHDNGYFASSSTYTLDYGSKNKKKARISYHVSPGSPYLIDSIIYLNDDNNSICHFIDSLARKNKYLQVGTPFVVDSLESVRINITNRLRNRGYYYFSPEYIEFLADSTISKHNIAIKITLASGVPMFALRQYRTGNITTLIERQDTRNPGTPDTLQTTKGELVVMRPARLRKNLIPSCITFRKGKLFSVRDMDRTQLRLSRLGIFSSIEIKPMPVDTISKNPILDLYIDCRYDRPMEASIEVNATSKSNSYIGPGLMATLTHHNIFGGGEKLSFSLNADYEWQTGKNRSSLVNSYEFGISSSLAFPRLLAPAFIRRSQRELNWTTLNLSANILNRPHYFKMSKFDMGIQYEWQDSRYVSNQFTPFKLTYTKLMSTTAEFDSIMAENPAIALSFQNQFIPQMSYSYTIDKFLEREKINGFNFNLTLTEAGNIFSGIWALAGQKGTKKLFGTPFSQFVKGQAQLVYTRRLIKGEDQWLVSRILIGAEHAYGNSSEVPYTEQFYIGGANSIRAFTVRSIGPGSYTPPDRDGNTYFDQTGTFKLELNTEYRFPLVSSLHGALFVDAGNVWLLKEDPLRPGGALKGKTFLRDIALGTGVGLRYDLGVIVIRGDLGYGLHAPYDTGRKGYFNIAFKDAFAFHLAIGYPF
jgi:outer membrane protein assembly factor BamA